MYIINIIFKVSAPCNLVTGLGQHIHKNHRNHHHDSKMAAPAPTRTQILSLYRQLIKNSKHFTNYNFREYFLRKSRLEFKQNMNLTDPKKIQDMFATANNELSVLKRQSIVSQLYTFDKTVIEPLNPHHKK